MFGLLLAYKTKKYHAKPYSYLYKLAKGQKLKVTHSSLKCSIRKALVEFGHHFLQVSPSVLIYLARICDKSHYNSAYCVIAELEENVPNLAANVSRYVNCSPTKSNIAANTPRALTWTFTNMPDSLSGIRIW